MHRPTLLAALALIPTTAAAQTRPAPATALSTWTASYDEAGAETRHTLVNRAFARSTQEIGDSTVELLLAQEVRSTVHSDREGADARVRTTAYARRGRDFNRLLWTVDAPGTAAGIEEDLYWVQEPACCATVATRRYFSMRTGRPLFHATSRLVQLAAEPRRRVAFLSANGTARLPAFAAARDVLGALHLMSDDGVRQTLLLRYTDPLLEMESPDIGVITGSGAESPSNTVWLRFQDGREVRIPVTAAGFATDRAVLPAGVVLGTMR